MQVIVTSYCRPLYLRQTVKSLRQDPIELYIVDGGSDQETCDYIRSVADGCLFFEGNPGADHLKTEGIKQFVTEPEFVITSDDIAYPKGYSAQILANYRAINKNGLEWTFCACNQWSITSNPGHRFITVNGVEILPVATSQVLGAIIDTEICRSVGYFPVYGKSGQGDWAFSKRLRDRGLKMGYWRQPIAEHIGRNKWIDYPEYSEAFAQDEKHFHPKAIADKGMG